MSTAISEGLFDLLSADRIQLLLCDCIGRWQCRVDHDGVDSFHFFSCKFSSLSLDSYLRFRLLLCGFRIQRS